MSPTADFDTQVDILLVAVRTQRAEVAAAEGLTRAPWQTNCSFKQEGINQPLNIQVATIPQLFALATDLLLKRNAGDAAAEMLGISMPEPLYSGYTFEQWRADLKKRVAILQLNAKKQRLDELERRVEKLVSPEVLKARELAALQAELLSATS